MNKNSHYFNSILNLVKIFLRNNNIDTDDNWDLKDYLGFSDDNIDLRVIEPLPDEDNSNLIVLIYFNKDYLDFQFIQKLITTNKLNIFNKTNFNQTSENHLNLYMLFIVDNIEKKIRCKEDFKNYRSSSFKKLVKSQLGNIDQIHPFAIFHPNVVEEVKIADIKRYDALEMPPLEMPGLDDSKDIDENGLPLKGYVFNVKLYNLIQIYNDIGDALFKNNVRYGIDDELNVDQSIVYTLENNPKLFWFNNNGITIIIEDEDFKLDRVNEIVLKRKNSRSALITSNQLLFSVINGAQTITASAGFFYQTIEKDSSKKDIVEKAKNEAEVLVRIIHVSVNNSSNANEYIKEISVALNRQKPIKAEDIALSIPFSQKLLAFLNEHPEYNLKLIRRGEERSSNKEVDLVLFSRAAKAIIGRPGQARSENAAKLLNIRDKEFTSTDIFPNSIWQEDTDVEKEFKKTYGSLRFALDLSLKYEKNYKDCLKTSDLDGENKIIISNGKWYFVSLVIRFLNGDSGDYSNFNYSVDLKEYDFKKLIQEFSEFILKKLEDKLQVNSNIFKTQDLFDQLLTTKYSSSNFYKSIISRNFKKEPQLIHDSPQELELQSINKYGREYIKVDKILINDERIEVPNATEAFVQTIQKLLVNYVEDYAQLAKLVEGNSFMSFQKKTQSYFKQIHTIEVFKSLIYIGTKLSFEAKVKRISDLIIDLKIKPDQVQWFYKDEIVFPLDLSNQKIKQFMI